MLELERREKEAKISTRLFSLINKVKHLESFHRMMLRE